MSVWEFSVIDYFPKKTDKLFPKKWLQIWLNPLSLKKLSMLSKIQFFLVILWRQTLEIKITLTKNFMKIVVILLESVKSSSSFSKSIIMNREILKWIWFYLMTPFHI